MVKKAAVVAGNCLVEVGDHWDVHGANTSLLSGLEGVLTVYEVGVDGASDQLAVNGIEVGLAIVELANLSGANECEVERPEEEHNILSYEHKIQLLAICHFMSDR